MIPCYWKLPIGHVVINLSHLSADKAVSISKKRVMFSETILENMNYSNRKILLMATIIFYLSTKCSRLLANVIAI